MRTIALIILMAALWSTPATAEEYAIIKNSLFGTQKIEIYQTQEEALKNFSGEGKLYRITRKEMPVKRVETRKKVEVTEYDWIVDEKKPKIPAAELPQGTKLPEGKSTKKPAK